MTTKATLAAVALLAVAGCSGGQTQSQPASSPSPTATPTSRPTTSPTPSPAAPKPGSMAKPATTSGPLRKASFPTPKQLGAGWKYLVDPGSAEEGYAGNGTPALARNPTEVVQTAVPFGCDRAAALPVPQHALEVDYRLRGAKVIAIRARFTDARQAAAFFDARARDLEACAGRSGSAAIGALVADLRRPARQALASDRTPKSDPYREVSLVDGDSVVLLAVQGSDVLDDAATRRLVQVFRS